ncbi:hypothetical protein pb186bvf_017446 [Paramecium bursaria]
MINNKSRKIGKTRRGRPARQQKSQQTTQTERKEDKIWFFDDHLVKIMTFLASQGSLLFKSESGQLPARIIKLLREKEKVQKKDIDSIKKSRQALLHGLQAYQNDILKQLEYPINTEYLLVGDGQAHKNMSINIDQGNSLNLIIKLLDPRFIYSFECIVNEKNIYLCQKDKHKMLLDWAKIKVLTKQGRDLLDEFKNIKNLQDILNIRQKVGDFLEFIKGNTKIDHKDQQFQNKVHAFLQGFYYQLYKYLKEPQAPDLIQNI